MVVALQFVLIILSITLTALVLLQSKGGGLGGIFGGDDGVYKTRRGVEQLFHQATIIVAVCFLSSLFW